MQSAKSKSQIGKVRGETKSIQESPTRSNEAAGKGKPKMWISAEYGQVQNVIKIPTPTPTTHAARLVMRSVWDDAMTSRARYFTTNVPISVMSIAIVKATNSMVSLSVTLESS